MYGYFRKDGSLYKIYLPNSKEHKFIKVKEYIQGSDQLTLKVNYLVICSSLKDIIAFSKLGYKNAEAIAPDSENILISESMINIYKSKYKQICTFNPVLNQWQSMLRNTKLKVFSYLSQKILVTQ